MTVGSPSVLHVRTLSLALVALLALVPLVPPEHAHQTETNGHLHFVVHQHSQFHGIGHVPSGPGRQGVFDHPDDQVLTLSTVFIVPLPHPAPVPDRLLVPIIQPPPRDAREALIGLIERTIHGPPRPSLSLRAPPCPCLS
jgi:hypothetical protein